MHPSDIVLVTGGGGFTGQALVPALRNAGATVVSAGYREDRDVDEVVDLLNRRQIAELIDRIQPTHVVHLAGISTPTHLPVAQIYAANLVGTVNLLETLEALVPGVRHILLPSSATVYARPDAQHPISEESLCAPAGHYAASKWAMEAAASFFAERLPIQIVRPFNYTGVGQRAEFFVPKIVQHFATGANCLRVGNVELFRDISSLSDIVETILRLTSMRHVGGVLNICSGRAVKLADVIVILEGIAGRRVEVVVDPKFVRADEPQVVVGSRTRLEAAIGRWPLQPLETTLEQMYSAAKASRDG